jgi:hypothetical protein
MMAVRLPWLGLASLVTVLCGCSTIRSSAVRTGATEMPPYAGPVAMFAASQPKNGAELGVVEVYAANSEAVIENLVPLFVKRVAQLGGNAAVIDTVRADFQIVSHPFIETYTYPCGFAVHCIGTRVYMANEEVMFVDVRGRAFSIPSARVDR